MIEFRKVEEAEIPLLLEMAERTFRIAYESHPANNPTDFNGYCKEVFTFEKFRAEWASEQSEYWFSTENQTITGYFKLNFDHHPPETGSQKSVQIERIYVLPEHQNKGIGVAMLEKSEQIGQERGSDYLWLGVWKLNPGAVRFYQRFGFEIIGIDIFVLGSDPQEDWMMGKKIN